MTVVIDAAIVRLIHVSPAAGVAAKSIKESTDSRFQMQTLPQDLKYAYRLPLVPPFLSLPHNPQPTLYVFNVVVLLVGRIAFDNSCAD